MSSLTGKPPFATDKPDSFYESAPQPQRRLRQPPPPDPNQRTSAYNLYDNYLGDDNNQPQPSADLTSGVGALGMGLLNMEDSDSEDEDVAQPTGKPNSPPGLINGSPSKHSALAAATATPTRSNFQQPQPQQHPASKQAPSSQPQARPPVMTQPPSQAGGLPPLSLQSGPRQHVPQPIAAPRPGYAAPIATLNLARPEPSASPMGRTPDSNLSQPHFNNPFEPRSPLSQPRPPYVTTASPAPSTPHPLHPSVTPITPAFIRPSKSPVPHDGKATNVKFSEAKAIPRKVIIRGNSEETLLPGRGEKGDDFWRRFSMVAKENERKESSWLRKTRSGSNRHSCAVWFTGIILFLLITGGIVLGLLLRRNTPSHQPPTALGGSADSLATTTSTAGARTSGPAQPSQTSLHVSPTLTLANREPRPSPLLHIVL